MRSAEEKGRPLQGGRRHKSHLHFWGILCVIGVAAILRLIPHPPNFSPLAAMALFGGAYLIRPSHAVLITMGALFLSDIFLGFHETMLAVYAAFGLTALLGFWTKPQGSILKLGAITLSSSVMFFAITNFAVWLQNGMYERTWSGLTKCYIAALPFFQNSIMGDFFYVAVFFGAWAYAEKAIPESRTA